jgi:pimeloyl-ACP methyl ester carboxylesterase
VGPAHRRALRGGRRPARGAAHPREETAGADRLNAKPIPVVVVHGLWLNGLEFFLLRDRLTAAGFDPATFRYQSTHATLADAADALAARLAAFDGTVHVVAHSLGGVVALEALTRRSDLPPGRVVLLGSPVQGSRAARAIGAWGVGPQILGALAMTELAVPQARQWNGQREIGVIAGSRSAGLGRLFASLPTPNDGTVAADETRLPGATSQIVLDVSHTGMLFSSAVAAATVQFLATGSFGQS